MRDTNPEVLIVFTTAIVFIILFTVYLVNEDLILSIIT